MIVETKFNFNDTVYPISDPYEQVFIPCKSCNATGVITLADGEETNCPKCYGDKGKTEWRSKKWIVCYDRIGKIGAIKFELYNNKKYGTSVRWYMLTSTGVGSGTLWKEEDLYISFEEAQAECDRRNAERNNEE